MPDPRHAPRARFAFAVLAAALAGIGPPAVAQIAPDIPEQTAPPARTLREIVDRYLQFRGPAYGQLQSIHERFYVDEPSGRRLGGLWIDRDGRMRRELGPADARQVEVAGPDGSWRSGADGRPEPDPGAVERARRYALLAFGEALTGRGGAFVALAPDAEQMDRSWRVVRVSFGDADAYEALIDPSTGQLCCYRITESGRTRLELFGDWRLVDGVRMPFAELTRAGSNAKAAETETGVSQTIVSAVELNRPLEPALFAKPVPGG